MAVAAPARKVHAFVARLDQSIGAKVNIEQVLGLIEYLIGVGRAGLIGLVGGAPGLPQNLVYLLHAHAR